MAELLRVSTHNPFEKKIGFSRAIRCGDFIYTAGTIAVDSEGVTQGADCYEQCCYILKKLAAVLTEAGSGLDEVVKVVCYLKGMEHAPGFERAHAEYLGKAQPASTCVAVDGLYGSGTVVELELTAYSPG